MAAHSGNGGSPRNPDPLPPFEVARSERIYDSPWCGLRRDFLRLADGRLQEHHVFEVSDAVTVVPFTRDDRLVMVGQYRHPHGKTHWETPAGRIDEGEDPAIAAARELLEETGHRAGELIPLPGFYPTNGISAHYAHAFIALDCEPVAEPELDPSERMFVRTFTVAEAEALLDAGLLEDGFTAIGLMYALRRRARG